MIINGLLSGKEITSILGFGEWAGIRTMDDFLVRK